MSGALNPSLIVASMDLKLVQLLRGAMLPADLAQAAELNAQATEAAACGCPWPRLAYRIDPTLRFEPRPVVHPTPRFESRPVYHPTPRYVVPAPCQAPANPEQPRITPSAVPPVWKTLPPVMHRTQPGQIKVNIVRPDIRNKGSLIDTFI